MISVYDISVLEDRDNTVISGIDDPLMRNPSKDFPFGTVDNSSVEAYFRRQV